MAEIKFDKRNYRKHNDKNKNLIKKSLKECGAGRSIVIDAENEIIGGNGIYEQAQKLNIPIRVIETDGTELIAVKRTDLKTDDEKRKQLAVMDNSTSDTSSFDKELLQNDFDIPTLSDWGIDIKEKLEDDAEVEFSKELLEEHQYIVLYFDNTMDWTQCKTLLGDLIKPVKSNSPKCTLEKKGTGRVLKGVDVINKLLGENIQ